MRGKSITSLLCFIAISTIGHAQAPDGKALLDRALKTMQRTPSLGIGMTLAPDGSVVENPADYKMDIELALEGKANALVKMKMGKQEVHMYENGKERSYYYAHKDWLKQAASAPREKMIGQMVGGPLADVTTWIAGFLHGNNKILTEAKQVNYIGEQVVDGKDSQHIFLEYADYNVDLFLLRGDVIPLNITFTLRKFSTEAPAELGGRKGGKVVCTLNTWIPNLKLSKDNFVYPKPVVKVEQEDNSTVAHNESSKNMAPNIRLNYLNGGTFNLASYEGRKIVVLYFWTTWCGHCKRTLPQLDELNRQLNLQNVEIVGVNCDDTAEIAQEYMRTNRLQLPTLYDKGSKAFKSFGLSGYPTVLVINMEGEIIYKTAGAPSDFANVMAGMLQNLDRG